MRKIMFLLLVSLLVFSCDTKSTGKKILVDSSGRMNHILMVINNEDWKGEIGKSLRNTLAREVIGLPQVEPMFHLNQISPKGFTSFLTANRNIIYVTYGDENIFNIKKNVYSKPQKVVYIKAKNKADLAQLIQKNSHKIIETIRNADINVYQQKNINNIHKIKNSTLFNSLNISMKIPIAYEIAQDNKDYLWYVKDIPQGYQNILIYSVPIKNKADINGKNIITLRNEKGIYIPGAKPEEGMHMITEKAVTPHTINTLINGKKAFETRGTWEMKGDFMAGPFLNYTIVDKENNRLIIIEGSIYAPNIKKRNYLFELEAILKTIVIL